MSLIKKYGRKRVGAGAAAVLALLAVLLFFFPVSQITVNGNEYYEDSVIEDMVFGGSRRSFLLWLKERTGKHEEIPFVEKYVVHWTSPGKIEIDIYEKQLIGYIEMMESYLYFDRDGCLVESSPRLIPDVPKVTGFKLDYAVLYQELPVDDPRSFRHILSITQFLETHSIRWGEEDRKLLDLTEQIYFESSASIYCYMDGVKVSLGDSNYIEEKLQLMADILPKLYGKKGVLVLDVYRPGELNPSYVFREDAVQTE